MLFPAAAGTRMPYSRRSWKQVERSSEAVQPDGAPAPSVPGTDVPGTNVPGTDVPSTNVPGTEAWVREAIDSYQRGDDREACFRRLFDGYFPSVERFFARRRLPRQDCLDLTQETFLGVLNGLDRYRPEARFETWLFKIATHAYLKRLRARATDKRRGREVAPDEVPEAAFASRGTDQQLARVLSAEQHRRIRTAVDELPEQMRQCLTLRLDQDLKYREIAAIMRISVETVKVHLFQARKKLRTMLDDDLAPLDP